MRGRAGILAIWLAVGSVVAATLNISADVWQVPEIHNLHLRDDGDNSWFPRLAEEAKVCGFRVLRLVYHFVSAYLTPVVIFIGSSCEHMAICRVPQCQNLWG
jgi:hypothetical protein